MSATEKVNELLKSSGAELVRDRKHQVWRLPNGKNFVRAKTPSDTNEDRNNLQDLRRALEIENKGKGEGERRPKKVKGPKAIQTADSTRTPPLTGSLAAQLKASGVVEKSEVEKARTRARLWKQRARFYRMTLRAEQSKPCSCWWCGLKRTAQRIVGKVGIR